MSPRRPGLARPETGSLTRAVLGVLGLAWFVLLLFMMAGFVLGWAMYPALAMHTGLDAPTGIFVGAACWGVHVMLTLFLFDQLET